MTPIARGNAVVVTGLVMTGVSYALVRGGDTSFAGLLGAGMTTTIVGLVLSWAARRPERAPRLYEGKPERRAQLLAAGVPEAFLRVLERDPMNDPLRGHLGETRWVGAQVADSRLPRGFAALSLYGEGAEALLVLTRSDETRFVRFEAEDGILDDYGGSFDLVLADLLIDLYEEETPEAELEGWARELGFARLNELLAELEAADRSTFEKDEAWRATRLRELLGAKP
jgi:hypothetical protein